MGKNFISSHLQGINVLIDYFKIMIKDDIYDNQ